jgi:quinol monooxygenase YgiN
LSLLGNSARWVDGKGGTPVKFVIGTFRFKVGTRDGLLADIQPLIDEIRREEGNVFFELNPKLDDPDAAFLCECFVDDAAHHFHHTLPHFKEMVAKFSKVTESADVKVHFADEVFAEG